MTPNYGAGRYLYSFHRDIILSGLICISYRKDINYMHHNTKLHSLTTKLNKIRKKISNFHRTPRDASDKDLRNLELRDLRGGGHKYNVGSGS